ncbi:MAG: ABC transporter ATP-binding protein [Phycisphaerales bacterium]|nr:ABC transporter ATP-binding protein [Phycisphaerales bacterium]
MTKEITDAVGGHNDARPLLEVADLAVSFDNTGGGPRIQAVAGVSLTIHPRQTLAVVGESGCGKSVTAMTSMQLIPCPPGRVDGGTIIFGGRDLLTLSEREMLKVRGGEIAMIFQEPMTSLNPVYTIGDQILEAILLHQTVTPDEAVETALTALEEVGMYTPFESRLRRELAALKGEVDAQRRTPAELLAAEGALPGRMRAARMQLLSDYPHRYSGGMRQRVMIAMALACKPKLLLADEPTTALDVTIQAQILELLSDIQRNRGMGMMLITHNLGVVAENADVVCVMYAGRVVEYAKVEELFARPLHPYTRGLFKSIPGLRDHRARLTTVEDIVDDPAEFRKLEGVEKGIVPWWPFLPKEQRPQLAPGRDPFALHEIEPDRWVGCWRTEHIEAHPSRRADLTYRRARSVVAAPAPAPS